MRHAPAVILADASLFPTWRGGPPSLTIMALAKRIPKNHRFPSA